MVSDEIICLFIILRINSLQANLDMAALRLDSRFTRSYFFAFGFKYCFHCVVTVNNSKDL